VHNNSYTILVFPGSTSTPKKVRIPKAVAKSVSIALLVLFVGLVGSGAYFTKNYFELLSNESELAQLRRDAKIQKVQVEKVTQQVKTFETEMARLERFEKKLRVITALESSPKSLEKNLAVGGPFGLTSHSFTTSLEQGTRSMMERLSGDLKHLDGQAKVQFVSFQELDEFFKNQKSLLQATPSVWPTHGWVTSGFGYRKSPFTGLNERHEGLDIASREGTQVRVTADGVVVMEGKDYGYGKMVEVDHGYGLVTRYGHNSQHLVKVGDRVKRGQVIALTGSTGRSTGPHLHYEVILHGVPVNPKNYILED
jgi:murein DD-endopeptidase MepM/ murein hydrolase activator NlpD